MQSDESDPRSAHELALVLNPLESPLRLGALVCECGSWVWVRGGFGYRLRFPPWFLRLPYIVVRLRWCGMPCCGLVEVPRAAPFCPPATPACFRLRSLRSPIRRPPTSHTKTHIQDRCKCMYTHVLCMCSVCFSIC